MELSQLNQAYMNNPAPQTVEPQNIQPAPVETKKDGGKKIALALGGLAVIAVAGIAIYKHKNPAEELKNIKFDKGVASLKENGEKFTGTIKDTLKNGDRIVMEYKDGVIQSSKRTGAKNISKTYETINGEKVVKIIEDGKEEVTKTLAGKANPFEKTFYNASHEKIDGVSLQKGKALLEDGSGFTGAMTTTNKNGQKIGLTYKDGFIEKSSIDGKVYKKYEQISEEIPRNQGVKITDFAGKDEAGNLVTKKYTHLYDENGKIKRAISPYYTNSSGADIDIAKDFKNGKLAAESQLSSSGNLIGAKIYDESGETVRCVTPFDQLYPDKHLSFTENLPDGSAKVTSGYVDCDLKTTPAAELKIKGEPSDIDYLDKNKKLIKSIQNSNNGTGFSTIGENSNVFVQTPRQDGKGRTVFTVDFPDKPDKKSYAAISKGGEVKTRDLSKENWGEFETAIKNAATDAKNEGFSVDQDKISGALETIRASLK